jgi:hypothetical protein
MRPYLFNAGITSLANQRNCSMNALGDRSSKDLLIRF